MYVSQYQQVTKTIKNGVLFAQGEGWAILSHSQQVCEIQSVSYLYKFACIMSFAKLGGRVLVENHPKTGFLSYCSTKIIDALWSMNYFL